ncbi:hypothetical protein Rs2_40649 [Raphanus sativus]|nr:hypothetical protein Rs2_40649 [Raphanus sativus]
MIRFLRRSSRLHEIPVIDVWKRLDPSRINETNYKNMLKLLCAERLMNEDVLALQSMINDYEINRYLGIYNSIIHGYADNARYGKWGVYDEIVSCVKRMEAGGCVRDHITYSLLVREFA